MKKIYFLLSIFLFFISCDDKKSALPQLTACFEVSKETLEIGEELQITNCSVGASSFKYISGKTNSSTEKSPIFSYPDSGDYIITLTVTSEDGRTDFTEKKVKVNSIESNYLFTPLIGETDSFFPINSGYSDNSFFYIEKYFDIFSTHPSKYYYVKIDIDNNTFTRKVISNVNANSGNAFLSNINNSNKLVYIMESLSNSISSQEIKLNSALEVQSTKNITGSIFYGFLENNTDYLYYGGQSGSPIGNPLIEIRNSLGDVSKQKDYNLIDHGFIGDLKKSDNGFIAFGGMIDKTSNTSGSYRPLIIFLDNNYEYLNHTTYSNTSINFVNKNNLNNSFHLEKLTNNNYVLYSHNEFRIIDSKGSEIIKIIVKHRNNIQALIAIDGGFIISSEEYLYKYNLNGSLIKSLKFNGIVTPNLILNKNKIYFISGYSVSYSKENFGTTSVSRTFMGAVDTDLNIINLN